MPREPFPAARAPDDLGLHLHLGASAPTADSQVKRLTPRQPPRHSAELWGGARRRKPQAGLHDGLGSRREPHPQEA